MFRTSKGQGLEFDFALAFLLFVAAWIFVSAQFDKNFYYAEQITSLKEMKLKADYTMDSLISSKGAPQNWEDLSIGSIERVGLSKGQGTISEEKLAAFSNLTSQYDELKIRMGVEEYDFYFEFKGIDDVNAGLSPGSDADEVTAKRIVSYKGGVAVATLKLYRLR